MSRLRWSGFSLFLLLCSSLLALQGCRKQRVIEIAEIRNGSASAPAFAFHYEDLSHPLLERLRVEEGLEEAAAGTVELQTFIALREWTRRQWDLRNRDEDQEPYPNALLILEKIRSGELPGGLCGEYAAVFVQSCLALGHQARLLSVQAEDGRGHRTAEVWSNDYDKWILMDPYFDVHFMREGKPLNALELHIALVGGDTSGITMAKGERWEGEQSLEEMLSYYHDLTVIMRNNHLSAVDQVINRLSLGYRDTHTDGRPGYSRWITERGEDLYWKVNQTEITVDGMNHEEGKADIVVKAAMPGLAWLEARTDTLDWARVGPSIEWSLHEGENRLVVRARNVRGVSGPPSTVVASYR